MNDTSHFQIETSFEDGDINENNKIDLHFRNVKENDIIEILRDPMCQGIQQMINVKKLNEINVYRKTIIDEAEEVLKNQGFSNNRSEKWISESFSKALKFQNNGIPINDRPRQRILQLTLDKNTYGNFRQNNVIPQYRSKGSGKSVYNYEGIQGGACQSKASTVPPTIERNIGINKNHIDEFNENIKSINVLDPDDPFVKNKFLRYLSENKLKLSMIAISVIYEIKDLIIILTDKDGQIMDKLTVHISEIISNQIGFYITSALASLLPGIGSLVIGVLGGIIFGFIGKKFGELIVGLFPEVAPGEGPPKSDYFSFIYGSNNCFGEPLNEYNLESILGIPKSDYETSINNVVFTPPTNNDQNKYIQMSFQVPK